MPNTGCDMRKTGFRRPEQATIRRLMAGLVAVVALAGPSQAVEIETGLDLFAAPRSGIEVLNRTAVLATGAGGLRYGQAIYSAASGTGGGAFFWGYEVGADVPLGGRWSAQGRAFVGGGGGAAQVNGDGLMTRVGAGLGYRMSDRLSVTMGAAWIGVQGAAIDDAAYTLGGTFAGGAGSDGAGSGGAGSGGAGSDGVGSDGGLAGLRLTSIGADVSVLAMGESRTRSGSAQQALTLVGSQARFALSGGLEATVAAAGAAAGGEGYMQILGGVRQSYPLGPVTGFAEAALGFGGGGDVDTAGGGLVSLGLGIGVPLGAGHSVELAVAGFASDGAAAGQMATLRLTKDFGREPDEAAQQWRLSTGIMGVGRAAGFGTQAEGQVLLQETALDMLLGRQLYLSGTALTALEGGVAGFAAGLFGVGYELPMGPDWSLAIEGQVGAAGGGGVDVSGGAIAGVRVEVDRRLASGVMLSMAAGRMVAPQAGGLAAGYVTAGIKIPFATP